MHLLARTGASNADNGTFASSPFTSGKGAAASMNASVSAAPRASLANAALRAGNLSFSLFSSARRKLRV